MWREIKNIIHENQHFIITTHVNPDGDGIGSATALIELLLMQNKSVQLVCDSPISSKFFFLNYRSVHTIYDPNQSYRDTEVVFVLDTHRKERIGRVAEITERPDVITACIDHHMASNTFTKNNVVNENACCVGAMLYTLFKESGYDLNIEAANGIYTSILCDTGRFSYSSTSRKAHKIADECIKLGVDPDHMFSRLYQHVPIGQVKLFAMALKHMETHLDDKVVIQEIRREDCDEIGEDSSLLESIDMEYIHEFNKHIQGVECVVLLREIENDIIRISLRSNSNLGINKLMKEMGGGGHSRAAGASYKGSLVEVKQIILRLLTRALDRELVGNL